MADRVTTVRLTEEQAVELELVSRIEGVPVAKLIRTAIAEYLTERKADKEFQARLRARIAADRTILERLAEPSEADQ